MELFEQSRSRRSASPAQFQRITPLIVDGLILAKKDLFEQEKPY